MWDESEHSTNRRGESMHVGGRKLLLLGGFLGDLLGTSNGNTSEERSEPPVAADTNGGDEEDRRTRGFNPAGGSIAWVAVVAGFIFLNILICLVFAARRYRINQMLRRYRSNAMSRMRLTVIQGGTPTGSVRQNSMGQANRRSLRRLDQETIERYFPAKRYKDIQLFPSQATVPDVEAMTGQEDASKDQNDWNCSICLDDFTPNDRVRQLGCTHIFHCGCIDAWIKTGNSCPLCRRNVFQLSTEQEGVVRYRERTQQIDAANSLRTNARDRFPVHVPQSTGVELTESENEGVNAEDSNASVERRIEASETPQGFDTTEGHPASGNDGDEHHLQGEVHIHIANNNSPQ